MKAKFSFSMLFSTLLFTVLAISASAQNIITANGNNTADTSNHFTYTTPAQWIHWYKTGDVQTGIVPVFGCDATCLKKRSIGGAAQVRKSLPNVIVKSNNHSGGLSAGPITNGNYATALQTFESSLFLAQVEFLDSFTEMASVQFTPDSFGNKFIKHGPGFRYSAISKQKGKDYPAGDMGCGQVYGADAVLAIVNGRARIVTNVTPPTPPIANNGNVNGGNANGNGNVSIPNPTNGSVNLYIIAGNGNGNPVVTSTGGTGGTGGSVGNTTATSGTPTGTAGAGATNTGGFNFGTFVPGAGVTTTATPPSGGAAAASTTSTTTNAAAGPDYTKQLRVIAGGTYVGPVLGALVQYGLSWIPRPAGSVIGGAVGGGLVTNPG